MMPAHTITRALQLADQLESDSANLDCELLLLDVIDKNPAFLRTWPDFELSEIQWRRYKEMWQRRKSGEPLAYILGYRDFWSLRLKVSDTTLIPRADTESLVERVLRLTLPQNARVLDLGTGTGAIALALASERPDWKVVGVDLSPYVVALAAENASLNNLARVDFFESDWFSALAGYEFDLIVCNPPYIDPDDVHLSLGDVRFEPRSALVSGEQGLADIRRIVRDAPGYLSSVAAGGKGWLVFEHGYNQGQAVRELMKQSGFGQVETVCDYGGNERVTLGQCR